MLLQQTSPHKSILPLLQLYFHNVPLSIVYQPITLCCRNRVVERITGTGQMIRWIEEPRPWYKATYMIIKTCECEMRILTMCCLSTKESGGQDNWFAGSNAPVLEIRSMILSWRSGLIPDFVDLDILRDGLTVSPVTLWFSANGETAILDIWRFKPPNRQTVTSFFKVRLCPRHLTY